MEQTFIMIKPDGVKRGLIGDIVLRFERKGFTLIDAKLMLVSKEMAEKHYSDLKEKPFFGELVEFISANPVFAMVWEGNDAVKQSRALIGATNPVDAEIGSIRGDFATDVASNIIHGSDSIVSADREINLFFRRKASFAS
ncbi:nucleoside-diphosphate kinase [Paenibacillus sp. LHD-38]|uniref:nucleoside-diphosphate kinase n=1 Tax=Paenibacillus sp. LHD-38 TaxID=3072143 RepID=UPI00280C4E96|nr:nucleoside-diphosphate kinase [Paenibacillus sp. LHD-38]MDQ8738445.1 nucleoside-diphosphate kinase [Paenibacillus sp. LHD-38]